MDEERFDYEVDDATRFVDNLKDRVHDLYDKNKELKEENERLNNIINELEKDLEDKYYGRGKYVMDSDVIGIKEVLTKLQELKGSDKE